MTTRGATLLAAFVCLAAAGPAACDRPESGPDTAVPEAGPPPAAERPAPEPATRPDARRRARKAARRKRAERRRRAAAASGRERRVRIRARRLAARGGDVNCGDLPDQATAQLYLLPGDPFRLDGDGDRIACNSLPCPCSKASGRGRTGVSGVARSTPARFRGPVVSVSDGDTVSVRAPSGRTEKVRLIGIDTPEVYGGVECGGRTASAAMKRLARGIVRVTTDRTQSRRDRYGRLLAYLDRNGRDLGLAMIRRGLASAYPYDGPFQRYPAYRRAERRARSAGTGSWRHCDISPP